jgi:hypothetical protein
VVWTAEGCAAADPACLNRGWQAEAAGINTLAGAFEADDPSLVIARAEARLAAQMTQHASRTQMAAAEPPPAPPAGDDPHAESSATSTGTDMAI